VGYRTRTSLLEITPWRDAAFFEDRETNSQAIILASDPLQEIRLRVAADYPPFFFGRMEAILRDTFKRYPGVEPERRLPCSCQPGCPSSYKFETAVKRRNEGEAYVTCDNSGKNVPIESLFGGSQRTGTAEGSRSVQSEMRRTATVLLQALRQQMEKTCPSVFTFIPSREFKLLETWWESATQAEELELVLYCEHDSGWHSTSHSLYRFSPDQKWFETVKKQWNQFLRVTKQVAPLANTIGKADGVDWPAIETATTLAEKLQEASPSVAGALSEIVGRKAQPEWIDLETRHVLQQLIDHLDSQRPAAEPKNGGLHRYLIDDGRLLWLCPEHVKSYQGRS
jgi:hypothetical protein